MKINAITKEYANYIYDSLLKHFKTKGFYFTPSNYNCSIYRPFVKIDTCNYSTIADLNGNYITFKYAEKILKQIDYREDCTNRYTIIQFAKLLDVDVLTLKREFVKLILANLKKHDGKLVLFKHSNSSTIIDNLPSTEQMIIESELTK